MPDPQKPVEKLYYTVGEVAEMLALSTSQIRYWDKAFEFLQPVKNRKGERRFTPQNIQQIKIIMHLVKERGFTIEGANLELERRGKWLEQKFQTIEKLRELRRFLLRLREGIGSAEP